MCCRFTIRTAISVGTEYALGFSGYRRRVSVDPEVARVWDTHRQSDSEALESFGVLIGTTSVDKRETWIEAVTTPMRLDVRSRFNFELRDPGHQQVVDEMFERSDESRIYLGTWHTHPEARPKPSNVDRDDWRACHQRNRGKPLAFVLVGIEEVRVFIRWGRCFRSLGTGV